MQCARERPSTRPAPRSRCRRVCVQTSMRTASAALCTKHVSASTTECLQPRPRSCRARCSRDSWRPISRSHSQASSRPAHAWCMCPCVGVLVLRTLVCSSVGPCSLDSTFEELRWRIGDTLRLLVPPPSYQHANEPIVTCGAHWRVISFCSSAMTRQCACFPHRKREVSRDLSRFDSASPHPYQHARG